LRIISFAWTTPALIALEKTVTRREWDDDYAKRFRRGDYVQAYDRSPRYKGKQVATIQLTRDPYKEWSNLCSDWHEEGFEYLSKIGAKLNGRTPRDVFEDWKINPVMLWVVRFEVVNLSEPVRFEHTGNQNAVLQCPLCFAEYKGG